MNCPNCNTPYSDPNKRFCGSCGEALSAAASSSPRRLFLGITPGWGRQMIYFRVRGRPWGVRRSHLLVVLLLLLFFISCCCLAFFNVQPAQGSKTGLLPRLKLDLPVFLQPLMDTFTDFLADLGLPPDFLIPPGSCMDFKKQVAQSECTNFMPIGGYKSGNFWFYWQNDFADFENIRLEIFLDENTQVWDGICETIPEEFQMGAGLGCALPDDIPRHDVIHKLYLPDMNCHVDFDDRLVDTAKASQTGKGDCCEIVDVGDVFLKRNPPEVGPLQLGFFLECDGSFGLFDSEDSISGDVFVNVGFSECWTEVICHKATFEADNFLWCTSPKGTDLPQKKSKTKVVLSKGNCTWEAEFQSPYYEPQPDPLPDTTDEVDEKKDDSSSPDSGIETLPGGESEPCDNCETVDLGD